MLHVLTSTPSVPSVSIDFGKTLSAPSSSLVVILALTLLGIAPSLLIMLSGFTRIVIVLGLTRSALGISVPPNQVLIGIALFLSLFVMAPVISKVNSGAVQPYLHGKINASAAYRDAEAPIEQWMLRQTGKNELDMMLSAAHETKPADPAKTPFTTAVPAFLLSQLESAFIIGFVIFVPFLIIDLVVSSTLMSMGVVMLPPTLISLPFKILLFVLVDGWALVVHSLITSFR